MGDGSRLQAAPQSEMGVGLHPVGFALINEGIFCRGCSAEKGLEHLVRFLRGERRGGGGGRKFGVRLLFSSAHLVPLGLAGLVSGGSAYRCAGVVDDGACGNLLNGDLKYPPLTQTPPPIPTRLHSRSTHTQRARTHTHALYAHTPGAHTDARTYALTHTNVVCEVSSPFRSVLRCGCMSGLEGRRCPFRPCETGFSLAPSPGGGVRGSCFGSVLHVFN